MDRWGDTKMAARGVFLLVGAVAVAMVTLERLIEISEEGLSESMKDSISGADFVLTLFIVPGLLWILLNACLDLINIGLMRREDRRAKRERRAEYVRRRDG